MNVSTLEKTRCMVVGGLLLTGTFGGFLLATSPFAQADLPRFATAGETDADERGVEKPEAQGPGPMQV